jgi:hypothetical protein
VRAPLLLAALALGLPAALHSQCYTAREGSPYDFVAAAGSLFHTDFSTDPVGEFPAGLEYKEGSMEVALLRGRRALKASSQSTFVIPLAGPLPESFTVEIGVVNRNTRQVGAETIAIYAGRSPNSGQGTVRAEYGPIMWRLYGGGANAEAQFGSDDADVCIGQETVVRLKVDGDRVRLYADERRLASVPGARFARVPGLVVALAGRDDADNAVYVTSIQVAGGGASAVATTAPGAGSGASITAAPVSGSPVTASTSGTLAAPSAAPVTTNATLAATPSSSAIAETGTATTAQAPPDAMVEADRAATTPSAPLQAPTGLQAKYVRAGRWAFVWNAVPGAVGYEVWVKSSECSTGCRVTLAGLTDTSVVSAGTFDYTGPISAYVRAIDEAGEPSPPGTPIALAPTPRYKGVYRVSISGLRVNRETTDNPLEIDGKRDEVLVRAKGELFLKDQAIPGSGFFAESKVHGDRNAAAWSTATSPTVRIKAGSASLLGGLRTGDVHRAPPGTPPSSISFPLLVWEGSLRQAGSTLVFVPTVWEVDRAPDWTLAALPEPERDLIQALGRYAAATITPTLERIRIGTGFDEVRTYYGAALGQLPDWAIESALRSGALPPMPLVPGSIRADSVDDALLAAAARIRAELADMGGPEALEATGYASAVYDGLLTFYSAWAPLLAALLNNEDRPIGIYGQDGQQRFDGQVIVLNFDRAESIASSGQDLEVRYTDKIGGGDYTLFIRVERLQ